MRLSEQYRPKNLDELVGNKETKALVSSLLAKDKHPQTYLVCGEYGSGKTTLVFIMATMLDANIVNCSSDMGVDIVRYTEEALSIVCPNNRVFVFDEAHRLTSQAAERLKVVCERPIGGNYFVFITDRPDGMDKALRSRCTELRMELLKVSEVKELLKSICEKEGVSVNSDTILEIAECCHGHARDAIKHLECALADKDYVVPVDGGTTDKNEAIDVARAVFKSNPRWSELSKLLTACKNSRIGPESIRLTCLAYGTTMLLKGGDVHAAKVMDALRENRMGGDGWSLLVLDLYALTIK